LFSYLRYRFYLPVWRRFIDAARLSGALRLPLGINEASLYTPEIRPPQMPWIDPLKELKAFQTAVECGFRSRQQVIRDMGGDPATVDAQLAADPLDVRPPLDSEAPEAPEDDEEELEEAA